MKIQNFYFDTLSLVLTNSQKSTTSPKKTLSCHFEGPIASKPHRM